MPTRMIRISLIIIIRKQKGRSAALNMVLTETGAAKAVVKAVPELAGKLTGNAVRVPIPNVSMAIMNLNLLKETTKDELNEFLRDIALHSNLQNQISYTQSPDAVSSDFVGTREAGIVDANATIAEGKTACYTFGMTMNLDIVVKWLEWFTKWLELIISCTQKSKIEKHHNLTW